LKKIFSLLFIFSIAFPLFSSEDSKPAEEIKAVFDLQREAWNEGDIDGFMAHYWKSDQLTFQSGDTRLQGWEALLARYKNRYPEGKMGKLDFSDLIVHVFSANAACVLGRWSLRSEGQIQQGLFTVILKRMEGRWKIIHDHTS
jgi:ketosteroid isomerase-like protein